MSKVIIDTNMYLDDSNIIFKLSREFDEILIPITVLQELDAHKFRANTSYSARNAIQSILDFRQRYPEKISFDTESHEKLKEATNDDKILHSALVNQASLATKDISLSIQAEARGITTTLYEYVLNNIFHPYKYVHMNILYDLTEDDIFAFNKFYDGKEYANMLEVFSKACNEELNRDSWFFVFINVDKEEPVIYANNVNDHYFQRIDNDPKYRYINVGEISEIKARDSYQVCAIYALTEAPHCLITGRWGSGKTLLSTAHTLANCKKKTFVTRAPIGINSKYEIGFLPGDKNDKLMNWMQGFMSALYYIYSNTRCQSDGNGSTYDFVRDKVFNDKFELMAMNTIQGLSLLDDDVLIVDEAQLITIDYMSMLLSRPSESGKLILLGDLKQTYGVVKPSESGLLKLLRSLPHKSIAYVELQNSYRSPLLEVADKLQDKTF